MNFEWEVIKKDDETFMTYRARVIGGWLIKDLSWYDHPMYESAALCESMVFVSDPNHEWIVDE